MLHKISFLVITAFFFSGLANAEGCGGGCAVSGGSSYNFLGDAAVNMDMSSFGDFIRDNLGNNQTTFHSEPSGLSNSNSSLGQIHGSNASQNATQIEGEMNCSGNSTSNQRIIKLGASK